MHLNKNHAFILALRNCQENNYFQTPQLAFTCSKSKIETPEQ